MDNPSFRFHLPELETFLVVLEEGQFSKAAERLCISQPTASSRVKKLGSVLRVQLLVRTTRRVEPTEEGRLLQAAAIDALGGLYDILRQFRDRSDAARNRVVVAATPMIAATFMPQIIHSYCERFPDVSVQLKDMPYENVLKAIADGTADLGVAAVDGDHDNLLFRPLAEEPVVLMAPSAHPITQAKEVTIDMLLPYRLILLARYSDLRQRLAMAFGERGAVFDATTAATLPTLLGMIDTGGFLTFMPRSLAESNARRNRATLELTDFHATRSYGSIVTRKALPTAAITSFREHLHQQFESLIPDAGAVPLDAGRSAA
ncbi:DNA-binding transcriptional regulator, LysR family [Paraburkholderia fungorum]|uniref:DNA-binding transcriptional regulator, LysR family n=1 Tax=Paraburkholderia fungorum TaxID=134537 RepID=A0A1H1JE01_9BURK|nr:LysR family transcriptional regulator [Paraburkholderia fungorum]SDR48234.1 DNA-binding transcriptional regulator, LysR family [Paraburkholderia fungorum]